MRSIWKIAAYFALLLAVGVGVPAFVVSVNAIPMDVFPKDCQERYLYELEVEHASYRTAETRQAVLIGPSYARELGKFANAYNMSLGGGGRAECDSIALQCRRANHIFYMVTVREYGYSQLNNCRLEVRHHTLRKLMILRGIAQMYLKVDNVPKYKPYDYDPKELQLLAQSIGSFDHEYLLKYSLIRIKGLFRTVNEVSIEPHIKLAEKVPQIVFIIHPMIPMQPVPEEMALGKHINRVIMERERMLSLFAQSGLSVIDLSNALPSEYFRDLYHLTPDGIELLHDKVQSIIDASTSGPSPRVTHARTQLPEPT